MAFGTQLPNIGMGNLIGAAQPPAPVQFLQGLAALPQAFEQGMADASQAQEARMQMQQMQMTIAQGRWDQGVAMIQKNPNLGNASNPLGQQMISYMQKQGSILGFPVPMDSAGNIDKSVWGTSFNDLMKDKDFNDRWWSSTEQGRRALAAAMNIVGVPDSAYTAQPVLTAQEQTSLEKVGLDKANITDIIKNRDLYTAARDNNLSALSTEDQARAKLYYAQGQKAISDAKEKWAALQQNMTELKMKLGNQLQIAKMRIQASPNSSSMIAFKSQLADAQKTVASARQNYNDLKKQIATAISNGGINDQSVIDLQSQLPAAQKAIDDAESNLQGEQAGVQAAINAGYGRSTSQMSGKQATVQTHPSSGGTSSVPVGTAKPNPQTGQMMYKWPDGMWYPTPPSGQ